MNKIVEEIRSLVFTLPAQQIEQGIWTNEELNNAIVAAYNRALDDASEKVGDRGDPEWSWRYCDWIDELKIEG